VGLTLATAVVAVVGLTALPPAAPVVAAPAAAEAAAPKLSARLGPWGPRPAAAPAAARRDAGPGAAQAGLFDPSPLFDPRPLFDSRPLVASPSLAAARFGALPAQAPGFAAQAPAGPDGWREGEFSQVRVLDGRTLDLDGLRLALAGIGLPGPGQMCRTLDGRDEPCAERARTQLELMLRGRTLACRWRETAFRVAEGACRLGSGDLADRMVRTGFAHRTEAPARPVAFVELPPEG
jgi:endonuclease YncB( thermonuclease family)